MPTPKLSQLELQIMETLWTKGPSSIRELQEAFPEEQRPAYTTVQTVVYRLEFKKAVRRTEKVANAHVFEALVSRNSAQHRMIDELGAVRGKIPAHRLAPDRFGKAHAGRGARSPQGPTERLKEG